MIIYRGDHISLWINIMAKKMERREKKGEYPAQSKYFPYSSFKRYFKGRVLELGSADGNNTKFLRNYYNLGELYCIEYSFKRIRRAKKKTDSYLLNASGTNLPFKNSSFDFVYCSEVIEHLFSRKDQEQLMQEIKRVLKQGGKCIITTPNHYLYRLFCLVSFTKPDPTHYSELTSSQFSDLLNKTFKKVSVQGVFGLLWPLFRWGAFRRLHDWLSLYPKMCKALMAVCEK